MALQTSFYLTFYLLVKIAGLFYNNVLPAEIIFKYTFMSPKSGNFTVFLISVFCELFAGVVSAFVFTKIDGKHRRAFDFITTIFFFHLFLCWIVWSFPKSCGWWFINLIIMLISYFVAYEVSLKHEMKDIIFSQPEQAQ